MPGIIAVQGSIGETADTCLLHLQNEGAGRKQAVVRMTESSLCHSHGAFASLLVDAECRVSHVDLNTKMHIETEVEAGGHVVLSCTSCVGPTATRCVYAW